MSGRGSQMRGSVKPKIVPAPVNLPSLKKESTQATDPSAHSNGGVWGQKPRTTQPSAPIAAPAPVAISPPAALPSSETPSSSDSSPGSIKGTYAEISAKHKEKEKAQKAAQAQTQAQAQAQKPESSPFLAQTARPSSSGSSSASNSAPSSSQQSSRTTPSSASSSPFSSGPSKIGWDDLNFDGEMDFSKPLVFGDQAESVTSAKTSDDRDPFSHDDRSSRSSSKRRDEYDSDEDKIDLADDAPRARRFPSGGEDSQLRTKVSEQDVRSSRPQAFTDNSRSRPFGRDSDYHSGSSQQRPSGRSSNWADDDEDDFDHNRRPDHSDSDRHPYDRRQPHSSFGSNGSDSSQPRRASRNGPTTGAPYQRRDQNESSFRDGPSSGSGPYSSRDPRYQGEATSSSSRGGASHRGHREGSGRQEERNTPTYSEKTSLPKATPSSTPAPRPAPVISSSTTAAPAPARISTRSWADEDDFDPAPAPVAQMRAPTSVPPASKVAAEPVAHQEKPTPIKEVSNEPDPEELKSMKQTMLELANKRRLEREREQKEKEEEERRRIAERLEKFNQLHPLPPPVQQPELVATPATVPVASEVAKVSSDHSGAGSQSSKGYKVIQREAKAGSGVPVDQQSGSATSTLNATSSNLKRKIKVVWIATKHRYPADGQTSSDSATLPQKSTHKNDSQPRQTKQQGNASSSSEPASVVTEKPSDGKWLRSKVIARSIKVEWLVPKPSKPRTQTQIRPPAKTSTSSPDLAQETDAQNKANGKARDPSKSMVIDTINKHLEPSAPAHQATETVIPTKHGYIVVSLPAPNGVDEDDEGEFTPVSSGRKKKGISEKVKDQQRPKDNADPKSKTSKNLTQKNPTSSASASLPVQTQLETKNVANGQSKTSTPAWTSPSDSIKAVQVALEDPAKTEYSDEVQVIDVDPDSPPSKPRRGRNNSHLKQQNVASPASPSKNQAPVDPQEPATLQELRDTSEPNWSNGQKPAGASPSSSPSLSFQEPNAIGSHLKPSLITSPDLGPSPSPSTAPPSLYSLGPSTTDSPSVSDPALVDPKTALNSEASTSQTTAPSSSDPKIETSPHDDLSKAGTTAPIGSAVGHTGSSGSPSDKTQSSKTRSNEMSQHHQQQHQQQQQQQMFGYPSSSEDMFARGHQQQQQQPQPFAMQWSRQGAIPQPVSYPAGWSRMPSYYYMLPMGSTEADPSLEDNGQMQQWSHRQISPRPAPAYGYVAPSPIASSYLDGRSYPASYYLPTQSYDVYSEDQYAHQGYPQHYYDYYDKQQQQQQQQQHQYLPHLQQQQHYQMQLQQQQQQQHYQMQMQQQQQHHQQHQQQMGYQTQRSDSRYNKSQTGSSRGSSASSSSYPRGAQGAGHHAHGSNYQSGHHQQHHQHQHQQQQHQHQHQANRSHRPLSSKAVSEISSSFASDLSPSSFAAPPNASDSLPPSSTPSSLPENDSNPESTF